MTIRSWIEPGPGLSPSIPAVGWLQAIRSLPVMLGVAVVLVLGALLTVTLTFLQNQATESGKELTESFAQVLEEQITRTLQTVDFRLQLAVSALATLESQGRLDQQTSHELLREQIKGMPYVRALVVVDAQGRVSAESTSQAPDAGLDLSDRDYFQIYRDKPQTQFHIGIPVRGRSTNLWTVSASRPLTNSRGDFAGVIVAALEPAYFERQWKSVDVGEGGSIALFRRNGLLLMRSPLDDNAMGKIFNKGPVFRTMVHESPVGSLQSASGIDGKVRTYAYRELSAQPDLVVLVGQSIDLNMAPWRRLAALLAVVWLAGAVAVVILCLFLDRAWRQKEIGEAQARQMAQRLALATDAASIGIWDWDITNQDQWYASPTYFTALGYEPKDGFADRAEWFERLHPEDKEAVGRRIQAVLAGEDVPYTYEARIQHADGSFRWIRVVGRVLARNQDGKPSRLLGVRFDITARKQAEEERLQGLERITDAFVSLDKNWRYTYVNHKAAEMFGREPAQLLGKHIWTEFPEGVDQKFHVAYEKAMAEQKPSYLEAYYPPYQRWFENYIYPSPDGLSIYFHDVTDRKLAEQAVVQREQRLRDLINGLGPAIFVGLTTLEGILLEANQPALEAAGLKLEDVVGKPLEDTFWVNYSEKSKSQIRDAVTRAALGESSRFDMQIRGRDDEIIIIDFSMQPMFDAAGKIIFLVPSASVITERKLAEDALRQSEERFRLLVDQSPYGIGIHQDGKVVMANRATFTLFGATQPSELIGKPVRELTHPDHWNDAQQRLHRMFAGELGLYPTESKFLRLDGSVFDVEVSAVPFVFNGGPAVQVIALDISKRKQAEDELRLNRAQLKTISRRVLEVQEAERRRVAVELHDELGQALTAIKINLFARDVLHGQSLEELHTQNLHIVEQALQQVRRMALTLRPAILDDLGLTPALRWLVDQAAEHNGFATAFHADLPQMRLAPEIESTFFRIAQAALTNVVRHAHARHLIVELFQEDGELVLTMHDDGCGFDVQAMWERAKAGASIGLLGMQERATLVGGQLVIESTSGQGSSCRLSCPLRLFGEAI